MDSEIRTGPFVPLGVLEFLKSHVCKHAGDGRDGGVSAFIRPARERRGPAQSAGCWEGWREAFGGRRQGLEDSERVAWTEGVGFVRSRGSVAEWGAERALTQLPVPRVRERGESTHHSTCMLLL